VEWILENQHGDGYWGFNEFDSSASRDVLLSTLACVVALKKWNAGPEEIRRGIDANSFTAQNGFLMYSIFSS
jgi:ent-kaurene synthase